MRPPTTDTTARNVTVTLVAFLLVTTAAMAGGG